MRVPTIKNIIYIDNNYIKMELQQQKEHPDKELRQLVLLCQT